MRYSIEPKDQKYAMDFCLLLKILGETEVLNIAKNFLIMLHMQLKLLRNLRQMQ